MDKSAPNLRKARFQKLFGPLDRGRRKTVKANQRRTLTNYSEERIIMRTVGQHSAMDFPSNSNTLRQRQWIYLGPIAATPLAHIAVTLYREAKTPTQRQLIVGVGIIGSTVLTLSMRLYLMAHGGYPGQGENIAAINERMIEVKTEKERQDVVNPSLGSIAKEALKGFG